MKILWVSLVKFPPLCDFLHENIPVNCGWIYSSAEALLNTAEDIHLGVVIGTNSRKLSHHKVKNIDYYLVPMRSIGSCSNHMIRDCRTVITKFEPDLIHIYGTEHSLALAMTLANMKEKPIVANIQGLASGIERYADGFIPFFSKVCNITMNDFHRNSFLLGYKSRFRKRANCEYKVIQHLTHVIGRTAWDRDHCFAINPSLCYYNVEETLRDVFYTERKWQYDTCNLHTIFVSNSIEPIKGAHIVIKALPIILRHFPDTKVFFAGKDILSKDIKIKMSLTGYNLYLKRLIKKLHLQDHVQFVGVLSAEEMKSAYLAAHVYVLPSAIENSPNSLGEAQLLGVPSIATYCGGIPDMIQESQTGYMYRYSEYEMLASLILQVFNNTNLNALSNAEIYAAENRHDRIKNVTRLINVYEAIAGCYIGLKR